MSNKTTNSKLTMERIEDGSFVLLYDGEMLPGQVETNLVSRPGDVPKVEVTFLAHPTVGVVVISDG